MSGEDLARELRTGLERLDTALTRIHGASANGNVVRLEGAGSVWNGIAIGIALAGVTLGAVWIAHTASSADVATRQAEAYHKAVYMLAPRFAEEVDKELQRQKERDKK
ncbi:TPA: hypothetical protein ACXJLS_000387 [Stenotrophomonas maltophilia]|uniref:hypothetical protein n=1 Tax=Stenotrophomonas maltophilia TaxID=40324 RepID=UPI0015F1C1EA|nr:hypothetical protein [Stenotrophomonas maltophilia]QDY48784.1 hypothetical protein DUW70_09680 [Stenotrophomonas maltophilia]